MLQNTSGQEIDYDAFKEIFDADPYVKKIVDRFDGKGLVIKTKEKQKPTEFGQKPPEDNAAAMRAANNVIQQPG